MENENEVQLTLSLVAVDHLLGALTKVENNQRLDTISLASIRQFRLVLKASADQAARDSGPLGVIERSVRSKEGAIRE